MIQFRSFENCDPPGLIRVWNAQPPQRALLARITEPLLDQFVLSKLYFDSRGLIVAHDGDQLVGFVHAGFGPTSGGETLDVASGAISLVLTDPDRTPDGLSRELVERAEQYLLSQGAKQIHGGATPELAPFYLGLYGGSNLCGVLESDERQSRLFQNAGYEPRHKVLVWQRPLGDFRSPMNRELLQLRRQFRLEAAAVLAPSHWWQACRDAHHEQTEFYLVKQDGGRQAAAVTVWDMEPLASGWGISAAGLVGCERFWEVTGPAHCLFLLAETCKQLQMHGIGMVETQVDEGNQPARQVLEELGFRQIDSGVVYTKP
jgi:GNAT superfamily N-acetyltransferase